MSGVYSKFFPRTLSIPAKYFTSTLDQQHAFAPFGPFNLTRPKVMATRAGEIVSESLTPPQSTVTKTIAEQTPYPELHSSRIGREHVANLKQSFRYPLV